MKQFFLLVTFSLALVPAIQAELKLPAVIGDHMVLQQRQRNLIWGQDTAGTKVTVSFAGRSLSTTTGADGRWSVTLAALPANATPQTLAIIGSTRREIQDVLIGEVWLCSGQSNMQLGIDQAQDGAKEIAAANFPNIRLLLVPNSGKPEPQLDQSGAWKVCTPENVAQGGWSGFSAAGYFFGRELHHNLNVPVGLIEATWGGTPIQPWMPLGALKAYPGYAALMDRKQKEIAGWPAREKQLEADIKSWELATAQAEAAHQAVPPKPWNPGPPDSEQYMPAQLYNAMIHPLVNFRIRGVLWYQGEANAGEGLSGARDYTDLQSRMIAGWRRDWGLGNFPFFFVQLPNWINNDDRSQTSWAYFREGQARVLKSPNTCMAVTIDIGDPEDIHPKNKQEVGRRLALLALKNVYHQRVVCQGPEYRKDKSKGPKLKIYFHHTDGGLVVHGGKLNGFVIAGADRQWHSADARIEGDTIFVSSKEVPQPVAARYDWANDPEGNLYNGAGLPAMPFRTDNWP